MSLGEKPGNNKLDPFVYFKGEIRIIEPITSRCSKFRFKPLDQVNTKSRLETICKAEGIYYEEQASA